MDAQRFRSRDAADKRRVAKAALRDFKRAYLLLLTSPPTHITREKLFAAGSVTSWPEGASNDLRRVELGEAYERAATRQTNRVQRVSTAARSIGKGQRSVEHTPGRDLLGSADSKEDSSRAASIAGEVRASVHAVAEACALLRALRAPAENCVVQTNARQILYRRLCNFLAKSVSHQLVKGGTNVL